MLRRPPTSPLFPFATLFRSLSFSAGRSVFCRRAPASAGRGGKSSLVLRVCRIALVAHRPIVILEGIRRVCPTDLNQCVSQNHPICNKAPHYTLFGHAGRNLSFSAGRSVYRRRTPASSGREVKSSLVLRVCRIALVAHRPIVILQGIRRGCPKDLN